MSIKQNLLLVIIVFLCLNYEHRNPVIINIIDNTVRRSDMTRVRNIISSNQRFRMSKASTRMLHYINKECSCFFE